MVYIHHLDQMKSTGQSESSIASLVGEVARSCILMRTRRLSRVVTGIYEEALRPFGVNAPQFSLLMLIARLNGASRAEIGRANHMERSTTTRNLSLLLSQGWIEEATPKGGRSRPILITTAGRDVLASAVTAWRSAQTKTKQLIGDDGAAAVIEVADSIPPDQLNE